MERFGLGAIPKSVWRMVLLSFILQVAVIGIFRQYHTRPDDDHFNFGWEMGRIARSIVQGHGFSSPYEGNTGPTAWEPPLYPFLIAGVFKVFGIYTLTSAWVLLTINCFFSAITTIPVFLIAQRCFSPRVAIWSAGVWALNPWVWYWSVHWIWDTTFTPFVLALIFLVSLELETWPGWRGWLLWGALWGVGALINSAMLPFLPFCGLWVWYRRYRRGLASVAGVALASCVFILVITPWLVRNYEVFGRFVFIRDDFGLIFRIGNGEMSDGMLVAAFQPNMSPQELERFQRMGELAYSADCKRRATEWIRAHPGRFAVISLKRFFYYWNGVPKHTDSVAPVDFRMSPYLASSVLALWGLGRAIRQKRPGAWLFAGLLLTYPTIYYIVFAHARFRHPLEPELFILGVFLISEAKTKTKTKTSKDQTPVPIESPVKSESGIRAS
jgi:4-amino-4-deoxy-L-arabinose transferase-like glycosyltransferase